MQNTKGKSIHAMWRWKWAVAMLQSGRRRRPPRLRSPKANRQNCPDLNPLQIWIPGEVVNLLLGTLRCPPSLCEGGQKTGSHARFTEGVEHACDSLIQSVRLVVAAAPQVMLGIAELKVTAYLS